MLSNRQASSTRAMAYIFFVAAVACLAVAVLTLVNGDGVAAFLSIGLMLFFAATGVYTLRDRPSLMQVEPDEEAAPPQTAAGYRSVSAERHPGERPIR